MADSSTLGAMKAWPIDEFAGPEPLPPMPIPPQAKVAPATQSASTSAATPRLESARAKRLLGQATLAEPLYLRFLPELSWEERVMGFLLCWAFGFALTLSSMINFPRLMLGNPAPFAWAYSIGNIVGIVSSSFLVGPQAQCEMMMAPVRLFASIVYLASIVLTMFSALVLEHAILTVLLMLVQFCALLWYCASYIPFGRELITKIIERFCCPVNDKWPRMPNMV